MIISSECFTTVMSAGPWKPTVLKKRLFPHWGTTPATSMIPTEKVSIINQVESQSRRKRQILAELGIPKSSYYRWRRGQPDPVHRRSWNQITPDEERRILAVAGEFPELSSRQLSAWITDNEYFAVSESTVYRILRREGLVKPVSQGLGRCHAR